MIVENIVIKMSIFDALLNGRGFIIDVIQSIQNILKILLQTTFQIAISGCFFKAATIEVASSGKLVQIATTVNQITASLIQKFLAISIAQFTIHFHHIVSQTSQNIIKIIDFQVEISLISSFLSDFFSSLIFVIQKV